MMMHKTDNQPSERDAQVMPVVTLTWEEWSGWRKAAGRQIDPRTAGGEWRYALTLDPYNVLQDLPDDCKQVGRECFARAPGTDVWIAFGDLPESSRNALWEKHKASLAFPAGLPSPEEIEKIVSHIPVPGRRNLDGPRQPIALTIAEACAAGRVGRTALYDAIKTGELRAIKHGRRTLILPTDLSRWLETMPSRTCEKSPP
jgi:excisionase family DNA binding protein